MERAEPVEEVEVIDDAEPTLAGDRCAYQPVRGAEPEEDLD